MTVVTTFSERGGARFLTAAILILLLATALRFHRLEAQSFWNDEGNSARLSERSIPLIIEGTASDIHPPLYYLLLRGWRELVGESEFGLRSLSAFLGAGVVALTFKVVQEAQGFAFSSAKGTDNARSERQKARFLALLAGLLTAVNPALIYYSQEARMYQLLAFLGMLATVLFVRRLNGRKDRGIGYVLALAAGLYTHYFFPAVVVAHGAILLGYGTGIRRAGRLGRALWGWLRLVGAAGILYLPWMPVFIRQAGGRAGIRLPLVDFLGEAGRFLALGQTVEAETAGWPLAALGLFVVLGLLPLGRRFSLLQLVGALGLFGPVGVMWLAGTTTPPFYKFMLAAVPPLALLAALGFFRVAQFAQRSQHRALFFAAVPLLGLFFLGSFVSLQNMYANPAYARADYRGIAARIAAESDSDSGDEAAVILNAANQWEVFTYYYGEVEDVYPLPRGFPEPSRIEAELSSLTEQYGRLYAIFWGEAERDPERLVERWLDAHTFKAGEEWYGDVRMVTYAVPEEPPGEMETAVNASFGESIRLLGYTVEPGMVRQGDILQVALFWETAGRIETRYKVFLHLVGEDGRLWSQRDSEPGGGLALTTTWPANERIQDNHGLLIPPEAPPGSYTLLIGLYDLSDPTARLPVETPSGVSDSYSIPVLITN